MDVEPCCRGATPASQPPRSGMERASPAALPILLPFPPLPRPHGRSLRHVTARFACVRCRQRCSHWRRAIGLRPRSSRAKRCLPLLPGRARPAAAAERSAARETRAPLPTPPLPPHDPRRACPRRRSCRVHCASSNRKSPLPAGRCIGPERALEPAVDGPSFSPPCSRVVLSSWNQRYFSVDAGAWELRYGKSKGAASRCACRGRCRQ